MRVVVFHYHLNPGGVTGVIIRTLTAVLDENPDLAEVILVSGSGTNSQRIIELLADGRVRIEIVPELGYHEPSESSAWWQTQARRIRGTLLHRYGGGDTVWWVHNFHLGKNPAVTRALLEVAATGRQRMLLHIHDFPECGRFESLARLHQVCGHELYPTAASVHYATINQRDRSLLAAAGVDDKRAWLIPNPVETPDAAAVSRAGGRAPTGTASEAPGLHDVAGLPRAADTTSESSAGQVLRRLHAASTRASGASAADCRAAGATGTPEGLLMFYPVRCIRRKNVLEAGLLARLLEQEQQQPYNLVVTLPGTSAAERGYSVLVASAFETGDIRGYFAVGEQPAPSPTFDELAAAADLVVSTSIQEGFGYAFFDPLCWGRPIVARELDTLCGSIDLFHDYPACLYDDVQIPTTNPNGNGDSCIHREELRSAYQEQLETMRAGFGADLVERVEVQLESLLSGTTIDFSYLSVELQRRTLRRIGLDEGFRKEVMSLNARLVSNACRLSGLQCAPRREALAERFGPRAVAHRLMDAFASTGEASRDQDAADIRVGDTQPAAAGSAGANASAAEIHLRIMEAFASPQYARLLYAPYR